MSQHQERRTRTACIVDGDNITRGGQLAVEEVSNVLHRLALLTDGCPVTFALQRKLAPRYMTAYAGLGWGLRFVSMEPDAADVELIAVADDYVAHGMARLLVVSGDHAFAELARLVPLHVVTYRTSLSYRLRSAAVDVTYLDDLVLAA